MPEKCNNVKLTGDHRQFKAPFDIYANSEFILKWIQKIVNMNNECHEHIAYGCKFVCVGDWLFIFLNC